jgi:hypothetical protein
MGDIPIMKASLNKKPEKHPMQPIVLDGDGVPRFKANSIVRLLLEDGSWDMNRLAIIPFSAEDREQFAQLIGYSISGFGELPYADPKSVAEADKIAEALKKGKK